MSHSALRAVLRTSTVVCLVALLIPVGFITSARADERAKRECLSICIQRCMKDPSWYGPGGMAVCSEQCRDSCER